MVPPTAPGARRPDGLISEPGPDRLAFGVAVAIALVAAIAFEWFTASKPVPPGGDPGTWLLLAYPYVGIPTTPLTGLFSYPPASFPFLGLAVAAGGGPLLGARIFEGAVIFGMALSFYVLGRSAFRLRSVALLIEAALLVQPDFQQLYYFGAYPNMFGFIFFFLTIGFGLRFLRSRRPFHNALFWGCFTVAVLSHALVGVFLIGLVGVVMLVLLVYGRLPREVLFSRVGFLGAVVFGVTEVAYYVLAPRLGTITPNYLFTTSIAGVKASSTFPSVLRPFYLQTFSTWFRGNGFTLSATQSLQVVWELEIALLVSLLLARLLVPRLVTYSVVMIAGWFVSVFTVGLVSWYMGLEADYRRFAYFLYPATLMAVGLALDALLSGLLGRPVAPRGPAARAPAPRWRLPRPDRSNILATSIYAVGVVVLLYSVGIFTAPKAIAFEKYFTQTGHDQGFIDAMNAIQTSGVPGNILSISPVVDRWPSTLTTRNLYEARQPTGFTYSPLNLGQDEEAWFATHARYAVTNGLVAATIPGISPGFFNATPAYDMYVYGVPEGIFMVSPVNVYVTLANQSEQPAYSRTASPMPTFLLPSDPSNSSLGLWMNRTNFSVRETITALPGTDEVTIGFTAFAHGAAGVTKLRVKVTSDTGLFNTALPAAGGGFQWYTNTTAGNFTTIGSSSPLAALQNITPANATTGLGASVTLSVNSTAPGSGSLSFSFTSATPAATNTATGVGGFYSTPSLWTAWDTRFALLWYGNLGTGTLAQAFLQNEFGATMYYQNPSWGIMLLPARPFYT